jgi:hypothetical protein
MSFIPDAGTPLPDSTLIHVFFAEDTDVLRLLADAVTLLHRRATLSDEVTLGDVCDLSLTQIEDFEGDPRVWSRVSRVLLRHGRTFRKSGLDAENDPARLLCENDGWVDPTPLPEPPAMRQVATNGHVNTNGARGHAGTNGFHANGTNGETPGPDRRDLLRKIHESKKALPDDPERFLKIGDTTAEQRLTITFAHSCIPQEAIIEDGIRIPRLPLVEWEGELVPLLWLRFLVASERGRAGLSLGNQASVDDVLQSLQKKSAPKQPAQEAPVGITAYLAQLQSKMPLSALMTKAELGRLNTNRDPNDQLTTISDLRKVTRTELQAAFERAGQGRGALRAIIAACRTAEVLLMGEAPPKPPKAKPEPAAPPQSLSKSSSLFPAIAPTPPPSTATGLPPSYQQHRQTKLTIALKSLPEKFVNDFCARFGLTTVGDLANKPSRDVRGYFETHYPRGHDPDAAQAFRLLITLMDEAYLCLAGSND